MNSAELPTPCRYFPLANGKYEVAAGLRPLGTDVGNGPPEGKIFQFDETFHHYRSCKEQARSENLEKYYPHPVGLGDATAAEVNRFIVDTLTTDWPGYFKFTVSDTTRTLECSLTSESIVFDQDGTLISAIRPAGTPPYRDLFDALASQVQEDLSIWRREETVALPEEGVPLREWMAAVHLCFPNHWSPGTKIGRPFNHVHQPVAGFGKLAKAAPALVGMMVEKGPFVRFAWGIGTDRELNHHPENAFQGRAFDPEKPHLELRIERQTLTPFPDVGASLFTIRTYFLDCEAEISAIERHALSQAIHSMSPDSLAYKGLTGTKNAVLKWLGTLD